MFTMLARVGGAWSTTGLFFDTREEAETEAAKRRDAVRIVALGSGAKVTRATAAGIQLADGRTAPSPFGDATPQVDRQMPVGG